MSEQLQIDLEGRVDFAPGDPVTVAVAWETPSPPQWIELTLEWRTRGRGTTDGAVAFRHQWHAEEGLDAAGAQLIDLVLPPGPLTYSGRLVAVQWAFYLNAQGADARATHPIRLGVIATQAHE